MWLACEYLRWSYAVERACQRCVKKESPKGVSLQGYRCPEHNQSRPALQKLGPEGSVWHRERIRTFGGPETGILYSWERNGRSNLGSHTQHVLRERGPLMLHFGVLPLRPLYQLFKIQ